MGRRGILSNVGEDARFFPTVKDGFESGGLRMAHSRFVRFLAVGVFLVFTVPLVSRTASFAETWKLQSATQERLENPALQETILGAIARLEDTQIRDRPGKGHTADPTSKNGGLRLITR